MRETSLDEFIGEGDGGGDGESEDEGTGDDGAVGEESQSEAGAETVVDPAEAESGPTEPEGEPAEPEADPEAAGAEPEPERDAVEPAVSTYDWTPTGADCEACGAAVERRWRADGRLVCADCKAW